MSLPAALTARTSSLRIRTAGIGWSYWNDRIHDSVVANAHAISIHAFHAMLGVSVERHSQTVDAGLNSGLKRRGQLEEIPIKISPVDLKRGDHELCSGLRTRDESLSRVVLSRIWP